MIKSRFYYFNQEIYFLCIFTVYLSKVITYPESLYTVEVWRKIMDLDYKQKAVWYLISYYYEITAN